MKARVVAIEQQLYGPLEEGNKAEPVVVIRLQLEEGGRRDPLQTRPYWGSFYVEASDPEIQKVWNGEVGEEFELRLERKE